MSQREPEGNQSLCQVLTIDVDIILDEQFFMFAWLNVQGHSQFPSSQPRPSWPCTDEFSNWYWRTRAAMAMSHLAQLRSAARVRKRLLLEVDRTYDGHHQTDATDPTETLVLAKQ
jgi:hypothetical protein